MLIKLPCEACSKAEDIFDMCTEKLVVLKINWTEKVKENMFTCKSFTQRTEENKND